MMYYQDNSDNLVLNAPTTDDEATSSPDYQSWIVGNCADAPNPIGGGIGTQTDAMGPVNSAPLIQGKLWDYDKSVGIYSCPADNLAVIQTNGVWVANNQRVRSYSMGPQMNGWYWNGTGWEEGMQISGTANSSIGAPYGPIYINTKASQIRNPGPASQFVFIEEGQSLDDGFFAVDVGKVEWQNWPTIRHSMGCDLSFADGHVQYWKYHGSMLTDSRNLESSLSNRPTPGLKPDIDMTTLWSWMGSFGIGNTMP